MRLIPAIDLLGGNCVRLVEGKFNTSTLYSKKPLEVAKSFEDAGLQYLHLVDLDAARDEKIKNFRTLERIVSKTSLTVDYGGGLRNAESVAMALEYGAKQVTIGSLAVQDIDQFKQFLVKFGEETLIFGADIYFENNIPELAISGWQKKSGVSLFEILSIYENTGLRYVTCTDIQKDGKLGGPSFSLYKNLINTYPNYSVISSGGVTTIEDLRTLHQIGCEGVILGKTLYEGRLTLQQLSMFQKNEL